MNYLFYTSYINKVSILFLINDEKKNMNQMIYFLIAQENKRYYLNIISLVNIHYIAN